MNETLHVYTWLYNTLHGDATLLTYVTGVYAGTAPDGAVDPYVVYNWQGGADVMVANGRRVMNNSLYQVKVVGQASTNIAKITSAADRIDTLLQRASGTVSGGTILFCERQYPLIVDNVVNGVLWTNVGGLYRIFAQ